ncbi:hypothetical protein E2L07_01435 [Halalkalibacterium halodurans]|uniref:cytochrome c oxidase assembly protein n=1 Tax=Halalkalibacterium halodurans TaxID=86665 RepID=UPI00106888B0|nr:cytochrome c oxidase assembly protein [Halalkalibacterium halodurans]TES57690.1 hypothetical protein E2L07_01435 [Halalkalibacterium halodurans]
MTYLWSAVLFIFTFFIVVQYLQLTGKKSNEDITKWRKAAFISGAFLFLIAQANPVLEWANSLFFVYMMQQTVTYFIVPILILLGLTDSLLKPIYSHKKVTSILKIFTKPFVILPLFNILFSIYYVPFLFDMIMSSPISRAVSMIILLPLSFCMWWPVVSPAKNNTNTTLQPMLKIIYIVGMGAFMTPLGAFIIFSNKVLYTTYQSLPQLYNISLINDQQAGGVAMKIIQIIVYSIMIAYSFSEAVRLDRDQPEMNYE